MSAAGKQKAPKTTSLLSLVQQSKEKSSAAQAAAIPKPPPTPTAAARDYEAAAKERDGLMAAAAGTLNASKADEVQRRLTKAYNDSIASANLANNRRSRGVDKLLKTANHVSAMGTDVLVIMATNTYHANLRGYAGSPRMLHVLQDPAVRTLLSNTFVSHRHDDLQLQVIGGQNQTITLKQSRTGKQKKPAAADEYEPPIEDTDDEDTEPIIAKGKGKGKGKGKSSLLDALQSSSSSSSSSYLTEAAAEVGRRATLARQAIRDDFAREAADRQAAGAKRKQQSTPPAKQKTVLKKMRPKRPFVMPVQDDDDDDDEDEGE